MTDKEIIDGLKRVGENNPNITIGKAVEQMMGLDLFWHDWYHAEGNIVRANIPQDCHYTVEDVLDVIKSIDGLVQKGRISLRGKDVNYGILKEHDLLRLSTPGDIIPMRGSDHETWRLLSNYYEIINN